MSGDLEIRSGSVVAVDTDSLRAAAAGFERLTASCEGIDDRLRSIVAVLTGAGCPGGHDVVGGADRLRLEAGVAGDDAQEIARGLRASADAYESVELRAAHAAAIAAGDDDLARALRGRLLLLRLLGDRDGPTASILDLGRDSAPHDEFLRQVYLAGLPLNMVGFGATGTAIGLLGTVDALGRGTIPGGTQLTGTAPPVTIFPVERGQTTAPASLAATARRIPGNGDERIRVERYTMPDGTRQFAVYVAGTAAVSFWGDEAFDSRSNASLYIGETSAAYQATIDALHAAGAGPGDVVHAVGHSQGAMIVSNVALSSEFDVRTVVAIGSPVQADVGDDTLSVAIRHRDDPVANLAGVGFDGGSGAPGSFVADRIADPTPRLTDGFYAHHLTTYAETAELLDASSDPRMGQVREVLGELGTATSVDVVIYGARVSEPGQPGGGGGAGGGGE